MTSATSAARTRTKSVAPAPLSLLRELASALASRRIRVVDLTQTLTPDFPQIALPPEMGQCWPFRIEEISAYDARGPGWYWNNFSCGEHTGTRSTGSRARTWRTTRSTRFQPSISLRRRA
jgi:hypothetical protein